MPVSPGAVECQDRQGCRMESADVDGYDQHVEVYVNLLREGTPDRLLFRLALRLLHLAGGVSGRRVLEASCGEGHLPRLFAQLGAEVVGLDFWPRWIDAAHSHPESHQLNVTFLKADLTQGLQYRAQFELVLDGVAGHIGFLRTVGDVPKPEGRFLLSLNNPYSAVNRNELETCFASGSVSHLYGNERASFEAP